MSARDDLKAALDAFDREAIDRAARAVLAEPSAAEVLGQVLAWAKKSYVASHPISLRIGGQIERMLADLAKPQEAQPEEKEKWRRSQGVLAPKPPQQAPEPSADARAWARRMSDLARQPDGGMSGECSRAIDEAVAHWDAGKVIAKSVDLVEGHDAAWWHQRAGEIAVMNGNAESERDALRDRVREVEAERDELLNCSLDCEVRCNQDNAIRELARLLTEAKRT